MKNTNLERNALIDIHVSSNGFAMKPDRATIAAELNDIAASTQTCSLEGFSDAIQKGHAFTVSLFTNGSRKHDNWRAQRIFCVDYDDGTTIAAFLNRCEDMDFPLPNIVHESYSSTPEQEKFHAIWILDAYITSRPLRDIIADEFAKLFPDSDVSVVKDSARIIYGTHKGVTLVNPVFTDLNRVFSAKETAC